MHPTMESLGTRWIILRINQQSLQREMHTQLLLLVSYRLLFWLRQIYLDLQTPYHHWWQMFAYCSSFKASSSKMEFEAYWSFLHSRLCLHWSSRHHLLFAWFNLQEVLLLNESTIIRVWFFLAKVCLVHLQLQDCTNSQLFINVWVCSEEWSTILQSHHFWSHLYP